jgi:hypothetical protein
VLREERLRLLGPDLGICRGAGDGNRTRTVSLGTGLSCLSDWHAAGQRASSAVREWPSSTGSTACVAGCLWQP